MKQQIATALACLFIFHLSPTTRSFQLIQQKPKFTAALHMCRILSPTSLLFQLPAPVTDWNLRNVGTCNKTSYNYRSKGNSESCILRQRFKLEFNLNVRPTLTGFLYVCETADRSVLLNSGCGKCNSSIVDRVISPIYWTKASNASC